MRERKNQLFPSDSRDGHRVVQPDHRQRPLCPGRVLDTQRRLHHHVLRDGGQGVPVVVPAVARHIRQPGTVVKQFQLSYLASATK